jgi:hypothetical protein
MGDTLSTQCESFECIQCLVETSEKFLHLLRFTNGCNYNIKIRLIDIGRDELTFSVLANISVFSAMLSSHVYYLLI